MRWRARLDLIRRAFVGPVELPPGLPQSLGGWTPLVIREPFAGAWQRDLELRPETVLAFGAVYACVSLISRDISKLRIMLMALGADGVWTETTNAAFSPVLRKPNHFQTRIQFLEQWMVSKLTNGNAYILKERDARDIVVALYVLDPNKVRPLIAPSGDVYYGIGIDWLAGVPQELAGQTAVPASDIIHDVMTPLFHPLCGVSPITACGLAALQGLRVQQSSATFFGHGSTPSGILSAPIPLTEDQRKDLQRAWDENQSGPQNIGKVAVLGGGLTYTPMSMSSRDAQLIEQLKWTAENVCTAFNVPPYMVGVAAPPAYNNVEALTTQYYTQCLQNPIECIELLLDEGLGMAGNFPQTLGTELDLDELLRMDTPSRIKAAADAIGGGGMSPNEARLQFHGLGPVKGGDSPMMQQQNFSLAALDKRDSQPDPFHPSAPPAAPPAPAPANAPPPLPESALAELAAGQLLRKLLRVSP